MDIKKIIKTDVEWKKILSPDQHRVLREKGTEKPFSGKKCLDNNNDGIYACAACGLELFATDKKFDSGSGWPSFYDVVDEQNLMKQPDSIIGTNRIEVLCARCESHLGHVFDDGPKPTGKRYCINCLALEFKQKFVL